MHLTNTPQPIPLLVIVHRDRAKARATINEVLDVVGGLGFDQRRLRDEFALETSDWVLHREEALSTDPNEWTTLCRRFLGRAQELGKVPGRKHWHVFLDCPAALALGLGASLGTRYALTLYHWQPPYTPVTFVSLSRTMDVHDPARFKAKAPAPPQYVTLCPPAQWTPDVLVALQLSAYSPEPFFRAQSAGQELALFVIGNNFDNVLPLQADWFQVALEVVDALRTVLNGQPRVRRLHLGLSCPVALAFAIGMGLGVQPPLRVYNWFADRRTYTPVLDLDQLRPLGASRDAVAQLRPPWETKVARERLTRLRQILVEHFEEGELKILCYDLGEDYEGLPGVGKRDKAQEMVARFERHGRSAELIAAVRQRRPHVFWED